MAGDKINRPWIDRARDRIEASGIMERLLLYLLADPLDKDETKRPHAIMTDAQARSAFAMLKKVLPDVANQTIHVKMETGKPTREMTLEQLMEEWQQRTSPNQDSPSRLN